MSLVGQAHVIITQYSFLQYLFLRGDRVSSEQIIMYTGLPEPQRKGAFHKHRSAWVMLGKQGALLWTLDACYEGRE